MSSAVSLIFLQQKNPGPIKEVYEKIFLFAGLESGFFKQSKITHGW